MTCFDEPLLTARQERLLACAIEAGVAAQAALDGRAPSLRLRATDSELRLLVRQGVRARDRFVRANLRLVSQLATREAMRCGLSRDELFQEGVVGLLEAVRRWDWRRELRFTTYAVTWIRNLVQAAAANRLGELNLAPRTASLLHQVRGVVREMEARGEVASAAAVGESLGMGPRAARSWMAYTAPVALGDALVVLPVAAPQLEAEAEVDVTELLGRLEPRLQELLRLRYGFAGAVRTQPEVAAAWGCSVRQVQRMEAAALAELRQCRPAVEAVA